MKIQQNKNGVYYITIPKNYIENLNWKKGDELTTDIKEDRIHLKKVNWED